VDIVKKFRQLGGDIRKVVVPDEQEFKKAY